MMLAVYLNDFLVLCRKADASQIKDTVRDRFALEAQPGSPQSEQP